MARPGYVSLYADERTQKIFDEFIATKGITKSNALTDMMTIYISQDVPANSLDDVLHEFGTVTFNSSPFSMLESHPV